MFKDKMIAPCGLNCQLCKRALEKKNPCLGCLGPDDVKPNYCFTQCHIIKCDKRARLPDLFCDKCPDYPCTEIINMEIRYANQYPMVESLIGNLAAIRTIGIKEFLKLEEKRWACDCGGIICVQTGTCSNCGKYYNIKERVIR